MTPWHPPSGVKWLAGVDEVGRGPLAGDVVTAAVILPQNHGIEGLADSRHYQVDSGKISMQILPAGHSVGRLRAPRLPRLIVLIYFRQP